MSEVGDRIAIMPSVGFCRVLRVSILHVRLTSVLDYRLAESTPPSTSIVLPVVKPLVTQNIIACAHSSAVPYQYTPETESGIIRKYMGTNAQFHLSPTDASECYRRMSAHRSGDEIFSRVVKQALLFLRATVCMHWRPNETGRNAVDASWRQLCRH